MTMRSSHLPSLGRSGVCIMLLATLLLLGSSAYAGLISIGFQETGVNSGNVTTVATGSGNASISGLTYGSFTINDVSAQDFADLTGNGLLNSQTLDISSSRAGVLNIWVTSQGLAAFGTHNFTSSFAVNTLSGSIVSVTETTHFSPANGLYNMGAPVMLNTATFGAIGTAGPFTTSGATHGAFSVTEQYTIFDVGGSAGNDNLTIDLSGTTTTVPEPASLGLIGAGLLGIALKFRR